MPNTISPLKTQPQDDTVIRNYGWKGTIQAFKATASRDILDHLIAFHNQHYPDEDNQRIEPQIRAWQDCIAFLKRNLANYPNDSNAIIFEYVIPRSGLCRPDVIIIQNNTDISIKVIEFKSHPRLALHEKCQISNYVRKLSHYHEFCHSSAANIKGILVSTHPQCTSINIIDDDQHIKIVGDTFFSQALNQKPISSDSTLLDNFSLSDSGATNNDQVDSEAAKPYNNILDAFINSQYKPSPAIIHTARGMYLKRKVPRVSTVESSNFYTVLEQVQGLIVQAQNNQSHHLIMVHGEPGSGKTFLGLEVAHQDYSNGQSPGEAIFLSGNRVLVEVLSSLTNDTFVQLLSNFKRAYKYQKSREARTPIENIIIFDEAQRAWDTQKMRSEFSEPDIILEIATRPTHLWSVVIALIGHGQEIKGGEEAGLILWAKAIKKVSEFRNIALHVHGAAMDIDSFKSLDSSCVTLDTDHNLYLDSALRNHDATQYHKFINSFLAADFKQAKLNFAIIKDKYIFRWTDDINAAKDFLHSYACDIHHNDGRFQYGALWSSTAKNKSSFKEFEYNQRVGGVMNYVLYHAYRELNINNALTDYESYYSNRLIYAANEYQCQGLELDMALVDWGNDLVYSNGTWQCLFESKKHKDEYAQDPLKLIINTYRVLLTRGRDATIVFTKDENLIRVFKLCGIAKL